MRLATFFILVSGALAQNPNTANFPGSAINLPVASSQAQSTLNGGVSSGATSLTLTSSTGFRVPGIFQVENERFYCTTNVANVLGGCTPGFDGTSQDAHSSGKTVSAYVSSWMLNQISAEVTAIGSAARAPVYTTTTYSATPTFTVSTSSIQVFTITLTGNVTSSTLSGTLTNGQDISFNICQDSTGSRTFVWPSNVTGAGTIMGTLSTCSRQTFRYDGTNAIAITSMTCPACAPAVVIPGSTSGQSTVVAPATGGGTVTLFPGSDTVVGKATTDVLTNKTVDAEDTGNLFTLPFTIWFPGGGCNNATAGAFWDLPTSTPAVATCVTGSNTQKGVLAYADTSGGFSAQTEYLLPDDWSGNVDAKIIWSTSATSGNAKWSLSTICTATNAAETDDASFNTASTVTTAAPGTANRLQTSSITSLTVTGCAAGEFLHLKLFRDGNDGSDTLGATANFVGLELKIRRAM